MGEKIITLAEGKFFNSEFEIELNAPSRTGQYQEIHIQSNNFRFEVNSKDFHTYAIAILVAERALKESKGIK